MSNSHSVLERVSECACIVSIAKSYGFGVCDGSLCVCVCVRVCMCMCFKMAATDSLRTQHCCECHLGAQKVKRYIVIDSTISLL